MNVDLMLNVCFLGVFGFLYDMLESVKKSVPGAINIVSLCAAVQISHNIHDKQHTQWPTQG